MTAERAPDVQRAIAFLSSRELAGLEWAELPPRPDYGAIARLAADLGHDLTPGAIRAAFQLIMRARGLASPGPFAGSRP